MTIPPPDPALVARFRADMAALTDAVSRPIGVAVSGGADSLALLLLAWAAHGAPSSRTRGRPRLSAISIDHGLRAAAAAECRFVADVCARLGVAHETVTVTVRETGQGGQAAARAARRAAFAEWAARHDGADLLTGHHRDDQAETVLMRLARGAGIGGLAGMPAVSPLGDGPGRLLRPLLAWPRATLGGIVAAAGLVPVADPANADPRYDRTRVRTLLAGTELLDPQRLANAAGHCRDADAAIAWTVATLRPAHLIVEADRVRLIMADWPREILRRLVVEALAAMGVAPDGPGTMRLIARAQGGATTTLAGVKVVPRDGTWTFVKAPPRRSH